MDVRKSDGSYEEFSRRKLINIIKKVFKTAGIECDAECAKEIVDSLYVYDGILCSSIRKQLEERFSERDDRLFIAYKSVKDKKEQVKDFVESKKKFIEKYKKATNTANATIDDNSNVSNKNVAILNSEIHKEDNIQISRGMIMDKLKEIYPNFNAKNYIKDLEHHIIYKHDESSFAGAIASYCLSMTMYPFLTNGVRDIGGLSASPKNIDSFCGMFCNLLFAIGPQFAGAIAVSEALLYFTYFAKKEWGDDFYENPDAFYKIGTKLRNLLNKSHYWTNNIKELAEHDFGSDELNKLRDEIVYETEKPLSEEELKEYAKNIKEDPNYVLKLGDGTRTIRGQIHQYWQQIIYTINQPARNNQSLFTNFSYFDKPFFEGMFGNFYFPDGTQPDWESLKWIEKEFMQWFNNERLRCLLTFPVESFTLLFKDGKFEDEEMFNFVCEEYARGHSFFTYISDSVDSLSSCCFDGDTKISYKEDDIEKSLDFKTLYEKYKDEFVEVYCHNPYNGFIGTKKGKIIRKKTNIWYEFNKSDYSSAKAFKMTPDHILPVERDGKIIDLFVKDIRLGDKMLFKQIGKNGQVLFNSSDTNKIEINSISAKRIDEDYCYCIQIEDEENQYFILTNGLITHNCRLKNKLQTKEFNFTNGNIGVMTGSKSVITLNLSRITQDWFNSRKEKNNEYIFEGNDADYDSLKKYINKILERIYKYHTAYNELMWDMYDAGLLPVYKAGFIDLNKQYLTIGVNGLNQAAEFLGMKCRDNEQYSKFVSTIFSNIKEQNTLHKVSDGPHKLTFNTEQVPAESLAIKNYNWDKEDGYWIPNDTNLYASYVYKPNEDISIFEKIRLMGKNYLGDNADGGSAAHLGLDAHLSKAQYAKILQYSAENGCSYLTFNVPNCQCDECGFIAKQPFEVCPKCGSTHVSLWDRIIGYLTKIKNWSDGRQIEQKTRVYKYTE